MEILTSNYKPLLVHDVLQDDMDAYIHPIKHYVTTSDGHTIILTGYRNGRLLYAVQTTDKTYKREAKKIEKYITEAIENAVKKGHYHASLKPEEADTFIITVPTPYVKEDLSCDLSYVISACQYILPVLNKGNVVIIESTIAPMSTDEIIKPIFENEGYKIGKDLYLAHCPERVLPGKIIEELIGTEEAVRIQNVIYYNTIVK